VTVPTEDDSKTKQRFDQIIITVLATRNYLY